MLVGFTKVELSFLGVRIDKDSINIAIRRNYLVAENKVFFLNTVLARLGDEGHILLHFIFGATGKGIRWFPQGNQAFHIGPTLGIFRELLWISRLGPVKMVDRVARIIRIMDEIRIVKRCAVLIGQQMRFIWNLVFRDRIFVGRIAELLGPAVLLTRVDKWCPLRSQNHQISQTQAAMNLLIIGSHCRIFLDWLSNDIKERQIIMGCDVLDHISWAIRLKIGWLRLDVFEDIFHTAFATGDKGWCSLIWITWFQGIANIIWEDCYRVCWLHPRLVSRLDSFIFITCISLPALTQHNEIWIKFLGFFKGFLDGLSIVVPHHIKAEAIYLVLLCQVLDRIHQDPSAHIVSSTQAAATKAWSRCTIRIHKVVVIGLQIFKDWGLSRVIIDHIHDNAHATLMNFVDKVFEFLNALGWICRCAGIHTCQRKIVLRVIAPVVVTVAGSVLVHALSIFQLIYKVIT